jgi:hypothetical protein
VSFTVTKVALAAFVYTPTDNHDPDGYSDGSTVTYANHRSEEAMRVRPVCLVRRASAATGKRHAEGESRASRFKTHRIDVSGEVRSASLAQEPVCYEGTASVFA